jgi:hypothetical protein
MRGGNDKKNRFLAFYEFPKIQNRRNDHVTSIKLSGCFGYAQRRRLRRVLEFRIWILFEIWDLGFEIWDLPQRGWFHPD